MRKNKDALKKLSLVHLPSTTASLPPHPPPAHFTSTAHTTTHIQVTTQWHQHTLTTLFPNAFCSYYILPRPSRLDLLHDHHDLRPTINTRTPDIRSVTTPSTREKNLHRDTLGRRKGWAKEGEGRGARGMEGEGGKEGEWEAGRARRMGRRERGKRGVG